LGKIWPARVVIQTVSVAGATLLALNAVYLVRSADQLREPGPLLARVAAWGAFPFGPEAGSLSIEDYCPLGPIEGAVRFVKTAISGEGLSFVGPVTLRNLGVFLAVVALVLLTKKTFCSWLCPFGAVFEFLGWMGGRLRLPRWRPREGVDRRLRSILNEALVCLVGLTAWSGTLIFKEIDPFYALYSMGSDLRPWPAYAFLALLATVALFHPGVWCHYLCPMGAALDPASRLGRIRIVRTPDRCTRCGTCGRVCPQRIPAPHRDRVTDAACTNCLRCIDGCPETGALELRLEAKL
jgi:polyferredoxin